MDEEYTIRALLETFRGGLLDIGYQEDLLQENYGFTDMFAPEQPLRSVELGAFALEPPSYRNACFGVVAPPYPSPEAIVNYRSLGAPQIFAWHADTEEIFCWKIFAHDTPVLIEKIEAAHIRNAIHFHRDEWKPETILRAKSIRFTNEPVQLDFFDGGLIPALESIVYKKLDRLLNEVIASCQSAYQEHHNEELDYRALFRLIFRLIAAKLLGDRHYPGRWLDNNAQDVIRAVENFYFQYNLPEAVLDDVLVQDIAWRQIRTAFSFRNLSVEALAYVYENTLVTPETRKVLGTHATPPEIAEYIVQKLPLEELPYHEYIAYREQWRNESVHSKHFENACRGLIRQIDAEILSAYNLPMDLEQEVIDYFKGYARPSPVSRIPLKPSPTKRLYTSLLRKNRKCQRLGR
jgi:hypothetical protein